MPEYLSPGVYIEEVSFEAHAIPGVTTSTQDDCLGPTRLERPRYFYGKRLTVEDFQGEQDYVREKLRLHNRLLHGWGVVSGLSVTAAPSADRPWGLRIEPGVALAPNGDEVILPTSACLDLAEHRPGSASSVFIGVRYAEVPTKPIAPAEVDMGNSPQASHIQDAVSIGCLAALPGSHRSVADQPSLCDVLREGRALPCPPRAAEPWVVLAEVRLPASASAPLGDAHVDNRGFRRIAISTVMLQEQVIKCCCAPERHGSRASLSGWVRGLLRGRGAAVA